MCINFDGETHTPYLSELVDYTVIFVDSKPRIVGTLNIINTVGSIKSVIKQTEYCPGVSLV